ncbi:MAG: hypothetical protein HQK67_12720, partial [Desulfamplus sp.]|nr:hypothetical protein [Desulfamplus sp.]
MTHKIKKNCKLLFILSCCLFVFAGVTKSLTFAGVTESGTTDITKLNEQLLKSSGRTKVEILIKRGEAYRTLGYYRDAQSDFAAAIETLKLITPSI